ncbi:MAG: hypothetical protein NE334_05560 [Lentisphaeraceae bacterium]|nr:hypothetical protein [Lentisphaeraceae bacterium]
MRIILFIFLAFLATPILADKLSQAKELRESIKLLVVSQTNFQKAFKLFKDADVSLLSANTREQVHTVNLLASWVFVSKSLHETSLKKVLAINPKSTAIEYKDSAFLIGPCIDCDASGIGRRDCLNCKATGDCSNSLCKEGKYRVKSPEFGDILMDCKVCKGTSFCTYCQGAKAVPGKCGKCNGSRRSHDKDRAYLIATKKLFVLSRQLDELLREDFIRSQKAKGLTEINGEWLDATELQAFNAKQAALAEMKKIQEQANLDKDKQAQAKRLLDQLDLLYKRDEDSAKAIVDELFNNYESPELRQKFTLKLKYW